MQLPWEGKATVSGQDGEKMQNRRGCEKGTRRGHISQSSEDIVFYCKINGEPFQGFEE